MNKKGVQILAYVFGLLLVSTFTTNFMAGAAGSAMNAESTNVQAAPVDWWPMYRHDLNHTGLSTSSGPTTNSTLWAYAAGSPVYCSPTIVDNFVYVGSSDGKIHCLNASTGALVWSYSTYTAMYSSPAVFDGGVYVGAGDANSYGFVYCLNTITHTQVWRYQTASFDSRLGGVYSCPAVVAGLVYFGCDDGIVYCLNASTGVGLWGVSVSNGYIMSSPAIVGSLLYVGATDGWVYCRNATNGNPVWSYKTGGAVYSSPAVVGDRLYIGSVDDKVYCLNATTGAHIWNYTTGNLIDSSPAVDGNLVYVGSYDGKVYCLNATTGAFVWSYATGDVIWSSSPAIANGLVYVGSNDTKLYCLSSSSGSLVWSYKTGGSVVSSPTIADGVVYVGSVDGHVYAFGQFPTPTVTVESPENTTYAVNTGIALTYTVDKITSWVGYSLDGQPNATIAGNTTLPSLPDGTHSLTIYANDTMGVMGASASVAFTVDTPPTGSIIINSADAFTGSTSVMLTLTYSDPGSGVSQVRYSNDGSTWSGWESATSTKAWILSSGDGTKTVYYQIKDNGGHVSIVYSDTIVLDTSTPRGGIQINNGAAYTNATTVSLSLLAQDDGSGVSQMRFSNDWGAWSNWEPYSTSKSWSLQTGDGAKIVAVQYEDRVNLTVTAYQNITLDTTSPFANAGQNQTVALGATVIFNGSGSTDNTGIASYSWSFGDGFAGTGVAATHAYSALGAYNATLTVVDAAGNSASSRITVTVQSVIPEFAPTSMLIVFLTAVFVLILTAKKRKN